MARLELSRIKPRRVNELFSKPEQARVIAHPVDRSFVRADYSSSGDARAIALLGDLLGNAARLGERITKDNNQELEEQGRRDALNSIQENGINKASSGVGFDKDSAKNSKGSVLTSLGLYSDKAYKKGFGGMVDEVNASRAISAAQAEVEAANYYVDTEDPQGNVMATYGKHIQDHFPKGDINNPYRDMDEQGKPILYKGATDKISNAINIGLAKTNEAYVQRARQKKTQILGEYIGMQIKNKPIDSSTLTSLIDSTFIDSGFEESKIAIGHLVYDNVIPRIEELINKEKYDDASKLVDVLENIKIDNIGAKDLITSKGIGQQESYGFKERTDILTSAIIKGKQDLAKKRDEKSKDGAYNQLVGLYTRLRKTIDPVERARLQNEMDAKISYAVSNGYIKGNEALTLLGKLEDNEENNAKSDANTLDVIYRTAESGNTDGAIEMAYNGHIQGKITSEDYDKAIRSFTDNDIMQLSASIVDNTSIGYKIQNEESTKNLLKMTTSLVLGRVDDFVREHKRKPNDQEYINIGIDVKNSIIKFSQGFNTAAEAQEKAVKDKETIKQNTKNNLNAFK
ncbi:Uncharacterised protein [Campylobacter hyointestinalis subsp. hyointestinalis]|uniref:Uncharacterized protein n=1 Tax=Campylobacter hyointestinalis subsp. hyointestinalis TaxID=91352 RepID=A0A0S4RCH4_CAMHY|nr:hypothetical protein [Campylobacter hyointestinalis]CUU71117.1 Uncharacterised protein [Campylobacter hyointestinalis subsp. hyointestinalis]